MNKLTSLVEKAIVLMFALINTLYHNLALAVSPSYRSWFNRKLFLEEQKTIQDKLLDELSHKSLIEKVARDCDTILSVMASFSIKREQVKQRENWNFYLEDWFTKYDYTEYKKVHMYILPTFAGNWSHMSAIVEMEDGKTVTLAWRKNNRLIDHICITVKEKDCKEYSLAVAIPTDEAFENEGELKAIKKMFMAFGEFTEAAVPYSDSYLVMPA